MGLLNMWSYYGRKYTVKENIVRRQSGIKMSLETEFDWYAKYEEALDQIPEVFNSTFSLISRVRGERDFGFRIIRQLMIDSGKYDVSFSSEDLLASEDVKLKFVYDEEGYHYHLIFPGQDKDEV